MLGGGDVVGQAQAGTGKTAAFSIPVIETVDASRLEVQAIVLTPTRELALQVTNEMQRLGQSYGLQVVTVCGGRPIFKQIKALQQGAQIVVGTPGRVLDHMSRGTLSLDGVRIAVLDEADEMLDIGFADDIDRILKKTPHNRQSALFSATMPAPIRRLVHQYLKKPVWVKVGEESQPVAEVNQVYYEVAQRDRNPGLKELLTSEESGQTIVFCKTQAGVDRLSDFLNRAKFSARAIHGGLSQSQRDMTMKSFRSGETQVLVATNVAARGLDIPAVSRVINYDMPQNVEEYVHRIGRTGRMGRLGTAVTFVCEWDLDVFDTIKRHVNGTMKKQRLALYS